MIADGPTLACGLDLVEGAGVVVLGAEQDEVVRPAEQRGTASRSTPGAGSRCSEIRSTALINLGAAELGRQHASVAGVMALIEGWINLGVGDVEGGVEGGDPLVELLLGDDERGAMTRWLTHASTVTPRFVISAATASITRGRLSALSLGVLNGVLLARSLTSSTAQNSPSPRTSPTEGCFSASARELLPEERAHLGRPAEQVEAAVLVDGGERRGEGEGVRLVRVAVGEDVVLEVVGDGAARGDDPERDRGVGHET